MNKFVCFFFLLFQSFGLYPQSANYFVIDGKIDPKYNDSLINLFTFTGSYIRSIDSTYVKNGSFHFEGPEYLYEKSIISLGNYPETVLFAELFLEKGYIKVEIKQNAVVHSPLATEYVQFKDSCSNLWNQLYAPIDDSIKERVYKSFFTYRYNFKKKHIHNGLGRELFLKDVEYADDPYFSELYAMLSDRDKSRYDVKSQYEYWKKRAEQQLLINKPFIDFTLINSLKKQESISDYIGKNNLLFIDFWASWCGPCLAQEPFLHNLYQTYKNKGFEILSISLDKNVDSWLSALKKKESLWSELCIEQKEDDKLLRELYHIPAIPYGVLIDKSGKIVYVVRSGCQELEMILKALD